MRRLGALPLLKNIYSYNPYFLINTMPHSLRKIFALIALSIVFMLPQRALAQKGQPCFGVETGYISTNNSAIAGLFFQYGFSNHFRVSPEVGCVLRHHNVDAFTVDLNTHYPLTIKGVSKAQLYPLLGINFSSWTRHNVVDIDGSDVTSRKLKWGVNMGAGFQFMASSSMKIKIEAKYLLISKYSSLVVSAGIGYCF